MANLPNENWSELITIGPAKVEIGSVVTDLSSLPTDYDNIGSIDGLSINYSKETIEVMRGFPMRNTKEFVSKTSAEITMQADEFDYNNLSRMLGESPSYTAGTGSTTVAASPAPTTTVFGLTSATNFAQGDLIKIVHSGTPYYRYIKTLSGTTVTVHKALPVAPSASDAVTTVLTVTVSVGADATPPTYSLKVTHEYGLGKNMVFVFYKVTPVPTASLDFSLDKINAVPIGFKCQADSAVDSGNLYRIIQTAAAA